jgi:arylsulfatase A-like enzyme
VVEEHATEFWTRHAVDFLEENHKKPFFLYLAYNGPYGLGSKLLETTKNRHVAYYADKEMKSFPRGETHPWQKGYLDQLNNLTSFRNYASEVSMVDDGVGEILASLEHLGVDDNTLVIFIADQGMAGGHKGLWGMGDHTRPLNAYDPTMWIPFIMRHPGSIPGNTTVGHLVANYDLYPTILTHVGLADEIPSEPKRPGRDLELLWGGPEPEVWKSEDAVYYEFENTRAIRTTEWKYIERIGEGPNELYHLKVDPSEENNLYGNEEVKDFQTSLRKRLVRFFKEYSDPKWDLWRGGDAKGGLILGRKPYEGGWDTGGLE